MKKKLIRKMFFVSAYDLRAIEEYLEAMVEDGLMFLRRKGYLFYFEACEPRRVKFFVDVFAKASIFDTRPHTMTEEYIEYCRASGWEHLQTDGKLQFFYTQSDTAVPIQTDDAMRLRWIHRNTLVTNGISWLLIAFIFFMLFSQTIMSNAWILFGNILIVDALLFVVTLAQIARYLVFYIRNKKRIKNSEPLFFFSEKNVRWFHLFGVILLLSVLPLLILSLISDMQIGFLLLAFLILTGIGIAISLRSERTFSRIHNIIAFAVIGIGISVLFIAVTFFAMTSLLTNPTSELITYREASSGALVIQTIAHDKIPVTLETLGIELPADAKSDTSAYTFRSAFGTESDYSQTIYDDDMIRLNDLRYEIVRSPLDSLLTLTIDKYRRASYITLFEDITAAEGSPWGAEEVYLATSDEGDETRLIRFPDRVLVISSDSLTYTEDVIKMLLEAMP